MVTRSLRIIQAFLLIAFSMACSLFTSTPSPSQAEIETEEQAVYALFVGRSKGPALILQETSTGRSDLTPQQLIDNMKDGLPGISRETIDSYIERNAQPGPLSTDMQLGVDYVLLSEDELREISSQPNWHEVLRERYPGSEGYTIFSRVGFNKALDQAVVYVGAVEGPLMGAGYYYLLEKQNGMWAIKEQIMVWIS